MGIFSSNLFSQAFVEHVLNTNILLFSAVLLQSECYDRQAVEDNANGNERVKGSTASNVIERKGSNNQRSNHKLDNAENNTVENIMSFDSADHSFVVRSSDNHNYPAFGRRVRWWKARPFIKEVLVVSIEINELKGRD